MSRNVESALRWVIQDDKRTLTLPGLDCRAFNIPKMSCDVVDEMVLLCVVEDLPPQCTRLLEIH